MTENAVDREADDEVPSVFVVTREKTRDTPHNRDDNIHPRRTPLVRSPVRSPPLEEPLSTDAGAVPGNGRTTTVKTGPCCPPPPTAGPSDSPFVAAATAGRNKTTISVANPPKVSS